MLPDSRLRALLGVSVALNLMLAIYLLMRSKLEIGTTGKRAQGLQCWELNSRKQDVYLDVNMMAMPMYRPYASELNLRRARLTHVVMPFHARQEETVKRNLQLWKHFPPCTIIEDQPQGESTSTGANTMGGRLENGEETNPKIDPFFLRTDHPAGPLGRNLTFTFFVSSETDRDLEARLLDAYAELPKSIQKCFSQVNVRFSRLKNDQDKYLMGSRLMFERMLNGWLGLAEPYYVLYMEPDCIPIRPNWLMVLDAVTRWPNGPFWIKGSVFRGQARAITNRIVYNLFHINGNAIYNLGDPSFRHFYFDMVRPYVQKYYNEGAYDTDIFKFLLDLSNYNYARQIAHMFQFSDVIQNQWHSNYSITELKAMSELVVLVHGGIPNP